MGVVAGEASGDLLGARVLEALQGRCQHVHAEGVGGPLLQSRGLHSHYPMDRLSVMGIVEPLRRLPELLRIRRRLRGYFLDDPPDLFLGIDSPEFNLPLAAALRAEGIRTAQLVSPSVWAWRSGRLRTIRRSVDRMFCLFPFETPIYEKHGIPARFVGHPLAEELGPVRNRQQLCAQLNLPEGGRVVALLPGSRESEVRHLGALFIEVAERLWREGLADSFVLPVANPACGIALQDTLARVGDLPLVVVESHSREAIAASDMVLAASGTATLEAALLRKPMVVAYRMGRVNWWLLSRLLRSRYVALPNILAGRELVPEYLQGSATVEALCRAVAELLQAPPESYETEYSALHDSLRGDFAARTAEGLLTLIDPQWSAE